MLTQEYLKEILHYDPETGLLTWKISRSNRIKVGDVAGGNCHGYIVINIDWKNYPAHRLAWLYMTRNWPKNQIDHINLNRNDNRWVNLREATHGQNNQNKIMYKRNKCKFKGVSYSVRDKKYVAYIQYNKKNRYLGSRDTAEEAYELYKEAAEKYHGEFFRY